MMRACERCLENKWQFKFIDGWVRATCDICGHEVEFEATRDKRSNHVSKIGDRCTSCRSKVQLKSSPFKLNKLRKTYFFTAYLVCPKGSCGKIYYVPAFKVQVTPELRRFYELNQPTVYKVQSSMI